MNDFINENEIRKTLSILKPNNQLFECRILKGKKTWSGYFKDAGTLLQAFNSVNLRGTNVYLTLNFLNEGCYSRIQRDRFIENPNTTSDTDVDGYQWMLIDFDPERTTGVSSSNEELKSAADLAKEVYQYLQGLGFDDPVKAASGNGYHLLYRINLANTPENVELIRNCLEVLSDLFSNEKVKVDTVNYNPSRICKLHGTLAQKGADSPERPHRMSRIFSDSMDVKITDISYLKKLAGDTKPKEEPKTKYEGRFNLDDFLQRNGLTYRDGGSGRDGSKIYALDECPFNDAHKNGDAKIFQYSDGSISFRCHHNSCSRYKWQDLRLKFEPNAYDVKEIDHHIEDGWRQHNKDKQREEQSLAGAPLFRTAAEIYDDEEPDHEYIRSGITEIDNLMHGLQKQSISMMSGLRASGKSTLIGNIILQAVNDGHTVVVYSGELSNKKYLNWITKQAAGKTFVEVSTKYQNGAGVPDETSRRIVNWLGDKFWLYNNKYGNNFKKISESLRTILADKKADLCIIDNLMALDLTGLDRNDKYDAQTKFVWDLKDIAEQTNTHILFVAHPKKTAGFIRLEDVSGTGNISNIVDNAFMVHRVNMDFHKKFKDTFGMPPEKANGPNDKGIPDGATNVIEIAKDRENGTMDYFIPLYFEESTKRMRNYEAEYVHYGWEEDFKPAELTEEDWTEEDLPFDL